MSQQNVKSFFRESAIDNANRYFSLFSVFKCGTNDPRVSLSSRFSRSSRVKPVGHDGAVPQIIMRRETHYGQSQGMPNLPDEYLLTLSDDSDYCSSDWESETDTELDADEMKKEGRLGWGLLIFTVVYLAALITAYVITTDTPLCVCHEAHPQYNTTVYKNSHCTLDKYKLEKGSVKYKKCVQFINSQADTEVALLNDTFLGDSCTMNLRRHTFNGTNFIFECNNHLKPNNTENTQNHTDEAG